MKYALPASVLVASIFSPQLLASEAPQNQQALETITVIGKSATAASDLGFTNIKELPINSHVVNRTELERLRFVDPDEFLDRIPGETQVRNLRIPDGSKSYTIPMIDGVPLESPYEGATARLDRSNTANIERIEIIKGPASALYPNNAFGGVVNIIPMLNGASKGDISNQSEVHVEAGEYNRLRAGVNSQGQLGEVNYLLNYNTRRLDGLGSAYRDDRDQFSIGLAYDLSDSSTISGGYEMLDINSAALKDLTEAQLADDPTQNTGIDSATTLEQTAINLKYQQQFESGQFVLSMVKREKDTVGISRFRGPQDENDGALSMRGLVEYRFSAQQLILGFDDYDGEQKTDQYQRGDNDLSGNFTHFDNKLGIRAYFVQLRSNLTDKLVLTTGLRYEDINLSSSLFPKSVNFDVLAPKIGINYALNDQLNLWAAYSEGFYAPTLSQVFSVNNGVTVLNTDLDPEESTNIEFGIRGNISNFHFDSSIYHNEIQQFLVVQEFTDNNGNAFEKTTNAGQVTVAGVETVLEYHFEEIPVRLGLSHSYTKNVFDSFVQSSKGASDDYSGNNLRRSPRNHSNARIVWLATEDLSLELEADLYSSYYADNQNSSASKFTRDERLHLRVDYQAGDYHVWLHMLNLTDTLEDRATYSRNAMKLRIATGRSAYLGISYQIGQR